MAPPGAVYDDLGTLPAGPLPDHEPSHRRRYGPSAEVQNVTVGAAHSGVAGRGTYLSQHRPGLLVRRSWVTPEGELYRDPLG